MSGTVSDSVISLLESHGATQKFYLSAVVTHCLAGDDAEEDGEVSVASELHEIPVLRPSYVEASSQAGRLLPMGLFGAQPGQLFSGRVFSVHGVSRHDRLALEAMIVSRGGRVSRDENRSFEEDFFVLRIETWMH